MSISHRKRPKKGEGGKKEHPFGRPVGQGHVQLAAGKKEGRSVCWAAMGRKKEEEEEGKTEEESLPAHQTLSCACHGDGLGDSSSSFPP